MSKQSFSRARYANLHRSHAPRPCIETGAVEAVEIGPYGQLVRGGGSGGTRSINYCIRNQHQRDTVNSSIVQDS